MDLTLTEAWALWWSGQQLTDHTIHGVSVLWAARAGKLLAFLAGTTIVLDAIGSERLVAWGKQIQTSRGKWIVWVFLPVVILAAPTLYRLGTEEPARNGWEVASWFSGILSMVMLIVCLAFLFERTPAFVVWFGRLLARPRFERWLRLIAVPLFLFGFALDYLAS